MLCREIRFTAHKAFAAAEPVNDLSTDNCTGNADGVEPACKAILLDGAVASL